MGHDLAELTKERELKAKVKQVIEALLFASSDPLPLSKIREVTDTIYPFKPKVVLGIIEEIQQDFYLQDRAFCLEEIGDGFVLRTRREFGSYIDLLFRSRRAERLSHASTEVLAIIAYRHPITRAQIDAIRGVDSSGAIASLIERNLIESVGKLEAPGRPTLYGITQNFLKHYGLKDLKELPNIDNLSTN